MHMTKPDPAGEDRQARFLGLFLKHQDDMRAVIGSFIRDRSAAEDVFQEMALTLWKKFDEACNAAYKIVEAWHDKLRQDSSQAKAQRQTLIDEGYSPCRSCNP